MYLIFQPNNPKIFLVKSDVDRGHSYAYCGSRDEKLFGRSRRMMKLLDERPTLGRCLPVTDNVTSGSLLLEVGGFS